MFFPDFLQKLNKTPLNTHLFIELISDDKASSLQKALAPQELSVISVAHISLYIAFIGLDELTASGRDKDVP